MSKLILGVGLPGSGKTTALKPFAEANDYVYISPDDIRAEVSGDASVQVDMRQVWDLVHERTKEALERGENVVVDATFVKDFERKDFIAFARESGATKVQGVFADVPYEIARERNQSRERVVPEHAMERMKRFLDGDEPSVEDGFDSVFSINELQELEKAEVSIEGKVVTREFRQKLG